MGLSPVSGGAARGAASVVPDEEDDVLVVEHDLALDHGSELVERLEEILPVAQAPELRGTGVAVDLVGRGRPLEGGVTPAEVGERVEVAAVDRLIQLAQLAEPFGRHASRCQSCRPPDFLSRTTSAIST